MRKKKKGSVCDKKRRFSAKKAREDPNPGNTGDQKSKHTKPIPVAAKKGEGGEYGKYVNSRRPANASNPGAKNHVMGALKRKPTKVFGEGNLTRKAGWPGRRGGFTKDRASKTKKGETRPTARLERRKKVDHQIRTKRLSRESGNRQKN